MIQAPTHGGIALAFDLAADMSRPRSHPSTYSIARSRPSSPKSWNSYTCTTLGWFRRVGRFRWRTRILNVPSAPRFFARKTSAMPPAPSRRTISKLAISFGGAGELFIVEGDRRPVYIGWPSRRGVGGPQQGRQWGSSKVRGGPAPRSGPSPGPAQVGQKWRVGHEQRLARGAPTRYPRPPPPSHGRSPPEPTRSCRQRHPREDALR